MHGKGFFHHMYNADIDKHTDIEFHKHHSKHALWKDQRMCRGSTMTTTTSISVLAVALNFFANMSPCAPWVCVQYCMTLVPIMASSATFLYILFNILVWSIYSLYVWDVDSHTKAIVANKT